MQVDLGGLDAFVAEPERDHGDVGTAVEQLHGRGVPQDMRGEVLVVQRRAAPGGGGGVFGERPATASVLNGRPRRVGNTGSVGPQSRSREPAGERGDGVGGKRRRAVFAPLAVAPNVWPGAQMDVVADESGQFGDPQAGLDGQREQGLITATEPGAVVGRGQQGVDLLAGQEAHQFLLVTFGGMASTRWIDSACSGWRRAA